MNTRKAMDYKAASVRKHLQKIEKGKSGFNTESDRVEELFKIRESSAAILELQI